MRIYKINQIGQEIKTLHILGGHSGGIMGTDKKEDFHSDS